MEIQVLDWTRAKPLAEPIRIQVFIKEQDVPAAEEWDKWDAFAVHVIAIKDGAAIGTGRLTREGKIGRMAVLPDHRQQGVGAALLQALLAVAEERGIRQLSLHAQTQVQSLYQKHGFIPQGEVFMECDIPHILMTRDLTK